MKEDKTFFYCWLSFVIGIILARILHGKFLAYSVAMIIYVIVFSYFYLRRANCENYWKWVLLILSNVVGFFVCILLGKLDVNVEISWIIVGVGLLFLIVYSSLKCCLKNNNDHHDICDTNLSMLFRERQEDLERLKNYLDKYPMVCIDADWGQGKTFLSDCLREETKKDFDFVRFKTVTYDVNNLMTYILNELQTVLDKQGILLSSKFFIDNLILKNSYIGLIAYLFPSSPKTSYDLLKEFCKYFEKAEKKVVLVFEDIDRIPNLEVLLKIFSIAETLTSLNENIKIIFECNYSLLLNMIQKYYVDKGVATPRKNSLRYMEKYLSYRVTLSSVVLNQAVANFIRKDRDVAVQDRKLDNIVGSDLQEFVKPSFVEIKNRNFKGLYQQEFPLRAVDKYLNECNGILENEKWRIYELANVVFVTLALKYFWYEKYEKLCTNDIFDVFTGNMKYNGKSVNDIKSRETVYEQQCADISATMDGRKIVSNDVLKDFDILKRYQYELASYYSFDLCGNIMFFTSGSNSDKGKLLYVEYDRLKRTYKNYLINVAVKHLCFAGLPFETDIDIAIEKLFNDVLDNKFETWEAKFEEYWQWYFMEKQYLQSGNKTIFLLGIPSMIVLFRAMYLCNRNYEDWEKFIKLIFETNALKTDLNLDYKTIVALSVCGDVFKENKEQEIKLLLFIFERFNKLKIIGNFNQCLVYWQFLSRVIDNLNYYVEIFFDASDLLLENMEWKNISLEKHISNSLLDLKMLKDNLGRVWKDRETIKFLGDKQLIIDFIEKNIDIISYEKQADIVSSVSAKNNEVIWDKSIYEVLELNESYEVKLTMGEKKLSKGEWTPAQFMRLKKELETRYKKE